MRKTWSVHGHIGGPSLQDRGQRPMFQEFRVQGHACAGRSGKRASLSDDPHDLRIGPPILDVRVLATSG
eukprot:5953363-Alexandrium_andersonii.AAC.1